VSRSAGAPHRRRTTAERSLGSVTSGQPTATPHGDSTAQLCPPSRLLSDAETRSHEHAWQRAVASGPCTHEGERMKILAAAIGGALGIRPRTPDRSSSHRHPRRRLQHPSAQPHPLLRTRNTRRMGTGDHAAHRRRHRRNRRRIHRHLDHRPSPQRQILMTQRTPVEATCQQRPHLGST
jgi:hypothetical protein